MKPIQTTSIPGKDFPLSGKGRAPVMDLQLACLEIQSTGRAKVGSEQMFQGSPRGFTEGVMCAGPGGRFIGGSIVTGKAGTDTGQEQMPIAFTFFFSSQPEELHSL